MGKSRAKPLPPVVVKVDQGILTPPQAAAWARLWRLLLGDGKEIAPAPGGENRGDGGETNGEQSPSQE